MGYWREGSAFQSDTSEGKWRGEINQIKREHTERSLINKQFVWWLLRASQVAQSLKSLPAHAEDTGDLGSVPGWEDPLEEEMATHSSILAWESHGQRSLAGYNP